MTSPGMRSFVVRLVAHASAWGVLCLPFLLSGCFLFSSGPRVTPVTLRGDDRVKTHRTIQNPPVYRFAGDSVSTCNEQEFPCWVTAIESCSSEASLAKHGLSRQLFVGFTEVRLRQLEPVERDGFLLLPATGEARIEGKRVALVAFQRREGPCVIDVVSWREIQAAELSPEGQQAWVEALLGVRPGAPEESV